MGVGSRRRRESWDFRVDVDKAFGVLVLDNKSFGGYDRASPFNCVFSVLNGDCVYKVTSLLSLDYQCKELYMTLFIIHLSWHLLNPTYERLCLLHIQQSQASILLSFVLNRLDVRVLSLLLVPGSGQLPNTPGHGVGNTTHSCNGLKNLQVQHSVLVCVVPDPEFHTLNNRENSGLLSAPLTRPFMGVHKLTLDGKHTLLDSGSLNKLRLSGSKAAQIPLADLRWGVNAAVVSCLNEVLGNNVDSALSGLLQVS